MSSRVVRCALVVLVAALSGCEQATDGLPADTSRGGAAMGGGAAGGGQGGTGPSGGKGPGTGGASGASAGGGAGSGRAGEATSSGSGAVAAGRSGSAGISATGGAAGVAAVAGGAGSAALGGSSGRGGAATNGGRAASGGDSALGGAGGEPDDPSACPNPFDTIDVSNLEASESFEPYLVTGNSGNQIRQSINQNRDGDYDAYTAWYITWQFADCEGNGLVVTADLTYSYPEWEAEAGASSELVASWEAYMDALFCHEYGHAEHGLDCANEVYAELSSIDAGGDCGAQQSAAESAFAAILAEYQALDVEYDAETSHGATMGAVFPP